jgi:hypothetical protein
MFFSVGGFGMKKLTGNAKKKVFLTCLAAALTAGVVSAEEPVIGTAQTSFVVAGWDATFNKDAIALQAYSRLLDAAQQKYPGTIDVRDVIWASGNKVGELNREITATGKIVQLSEEQATSGVVLTSFVARAWDSLFNKKNIETQAYIKLLEAAQQKYPGTVDVYDIVWEKSSNAGGENTKIFATGKTTNVSAEPKAGSEAVNGVVQTSFVSTGWDATFNKPVIKTQAYIKLLEAAQQKYPGAVDITDIVWVSGKSIDHQNSEIIASGKVVRGN